MFNIVELDILDNVKHSRDHIVKSLFRDLNSNVDVLKKVNSKIRGFIISDAD